MTPTEPAGWVCMAVYKPDAELLQRQIDSIRNQTASEWVCEIGIDGEDADAADLVRSIIRDDPRFRMVEFSENVGFYRNFERLLARVPDEADWVALSDQDDNWYSGKFEVLIPILQDVALVTGQANVVDASGRVAGEPTLRRAVGLVAEMIDNQVTGSLCIMRRSLLELALPFPEPTDSGYHDHWLGVCAMVSGGVGVSAEHVQDYIQHGANVIGEEGAPSLRTRLARLASASEGGLASRVGYLRAHRWWWRVVMARAILDRVGHVGAADERILRAIASGRLTITLLRSFTRAVLSRQAPPLRTLGLVVGAAWSPRRQ